MVDAARTTRVASEDIIFVGRATIVATRSLWKERMKLSRKVWRSSSYFYKAIPTQT